MKIEWFKQIAKLIKSPSLPVSEKIENKENSVINKEIDKEVSCTFSSYKKPLPPLISEVRQNAILNKGFTKKVMGYIPPPSVPKEAIKGKDVMATPPPDLEDENMKALKHLRELPRGTQVDSRIAGIQNLLREHEIFKTLQMLRWPQGVVCPRCHASNIVRRDPPPNATDQRYYYVCLNCKGEGDPSEFDDFTGLPIGSLHGLRRWVLCWYLLGFCSVHQIAKVLGVSVQEVFQMATIGSELTSLPDPEVDKKIKKAAKEKEEKTQSQKRKLSEEEKEQSDNSAGRSPFNPKYKSRK